MSADVTPVTATEARTLQVGGATLLDVREDDEWGSGRAPDARHIRLSEVPDHVDALPTDQVIVCVCRAGHRSMRAAHFLASEGFDVRNLDGGMQAWVDAGLPLEGESDAPSVI